jgi:SAM-dependent methyltransferase
MTRVFDRDYSSSYDLIYQDKDYDKECDIIEQIIKDNCKKPVLSILDFGCGTGNHSIRLAQRGYHVTGVDRSEDMLKIARTKTQNNGWDCEFYQSNIKEFSNNKKYDVVIMMFAVLGYQIENDEVLQVLNAVKKHLKQGGIFICDVWYGPAVLHEKPGERVRVIQKGNTKIIRVSTGVLDIFHHFVDVHFHLWKIKADRIISETTEKHKMRFFFPQELIFFLNQTGFVPLSIGCFPEINKEPDETTWNILIVALQNKSGFSRK